MTNIDTSDWKEFKIEDLFTAESGDFDIQKNHINDLGIEIITSGTTDNGVLGKSDINAKVIKGNTLTVDMFGNCIYRDHDYKMVTHARVFALVPIYKEFDEKAGLFISTMINKLTGEFSYSNMCSWAKIKKLTVKLPVKESEEIAWEFMEKYIRAVEKIVIADVVKYKDEVISTTKGIISKAC